MEHVGYKLVDESGASIDQWGGVLGQCPGVPDFIDIPDGSRVYCPEINVSYNGFKLITWDVDPSSLAQSIVPESINLAQARCELRALGVFDKIDTNINSDPTSAVCDAWNYGNGVTRGQTLATFIQTTLAWTDAQMDEFMTAAAARSL